MSAVVELLPAVAEPSLDELATTANREHRLARQAAESLLTHAFNVGDALLAAKARVPRGEWLSWTYQNIDMHPQDMRNYMRVARYRDQVLEANATSIASALRHLQGQPDIRRVVVAPEIIDSVIAGDLSRADAAEAAGVTVDVISKRVRGRDRNRRNGRRVAAERRQGQDEQRDRLFEQQGSERLRTAHTFLRRARAEIARYAAEDPTNAERQQQARQAVGYVNAADKWLAKMLPAREQP